MGAILNSISRTPHGAKGSPTRFYRIGREDREARTFEHEAGLMTRVDGSAFRLMEAGAVDAWVGHVGEVVGEGQFLVALPGHPPWRLGVEGEGLSERATVPHLEATH